MHDPTRQLVLFDIGNVLISLRPLELVLPLEALCSWGGVPRDKILADLAVFARSQIADFFERGIATKEQFLEALLAILPLTLSANELEDRYKGILGKEVPGMLELIRQLKTAGVRVAGLTDTNPIHLELLRSYPAVQELETVIASCLTGRRKPKPETFLNALEILRVRPSQVYYTDDLPSNVEGARRAGIQADTFRGAADLRATLGKD